MIEQDIKKAVEGALVSLGVKDAKISLEHPEDMAHGDYATSVALAYAKELKMSPRALAERIVDAIRQGDTSKRGITFPNVEKIEIAGPGFINFRLSKKVFTDSLKEIIKKSEDFGKNNELKGKVVMLEYTSPNLFKPLHIGNLVGNILGESVGRLLGASGALVKKINYPSDIGLTVAKGVWGLKKTNADPKDIKALGEAYRIGNTAYEEDPTAKQEIESINKALYENSDSSLTALRKAGIETSLSHLRDLCQKLGTTFDTEFFESQSALLGRDIVEGHVSDGIFEKSEGAVVYKGEQEGLHTRVFLNSQGLPTYEAKEVGLFKLKSSAYPKFDFSITVTGNEQTDFFKVVFAAIRKIFKKETAGKELLHIANGFLRLTTGKMSSRKGNVITGESLISDIENMVQEKIKERGFNEKESAEISEIVAIGAIKYSILRQQAGSDIIYDPEKSISFEGDSGPYLQYTYVRAKSVLAEAKKSKIKSSVKNPPAEVGLLEKLLVRFPEIVERSAKEYAPHYVATYLIELAGAFNGYYANHKIADPANPEAPYRVALTEAVTITLKNGLYILGIRTPKKM